MKNIFIVLILFSAMLFSCSSTKLTMREGNSFIKFTSDDFNISEQVFGEANSVKVFCIDWERLFQDMSARVTPTLASPPENFILSIIGYKSSDKVVGFALWDMVQKNPGYDFLLYPQYEVDIVRPILGIGLFYKKISVKATARLGKLK